MCSRVLILALESSCDETAAAVVEATPDPASPCGLRLRARADAVASQAQIHNSFGGVVPEVASRQHLLHVLPVIDQALREAGVGLDAIGGLAVTRGPGLIGALLVAVQTAKAIAFARGLPLVGVNHLEGHLLAPYLDDEAPPLPHLGVLVSGGHTLLVRCDRRPPDGALPVGAADYRVLGSTRDDAAGEAFDKGGKLLGLGYPAGPVIDRLARGGDPGAVVFPHPASGHRCSVATHPGVGVRATRPGVGVLPWERRKSRLQPFRLDHARRRRSAGSRLASLPHPTLGAVEIGRAHV